MIQSYDLRLVPETFEHVSNTKLFLEDLDFLDVTQVLHGTVPNRVDRLLELPRLCRTPG